LIAALALPGFAQGTAPEVVQDAPACGSATFAEFAAAQAEPNGPASPPSSAEATGGWFSCFSVAAQSWLSWAGSESSFRIGPVNVASDLKWRNLVGETGEVSVSGLFCERIIITAMAGIRAISSGSLVDKDFALPDRQGIFSESISPAPSDHLGYGTAYLGWRFAETPNFFFDGLVGYQYWRERYLTNGGTQVIGLPFSGVPPPGTAFPPVSGISETYTWQGFQIGVEWSLQFPDRWSVKSRIMAMPIPQFENDDIHYLRVPELTATDRASGGFGVMADLGVTYWLCQGLFMELGYRIWDATSGRGETIESFAGVPSVNLPFNRAQTVRQGLTLGFTYQF